MVYASLFCPANISIIISKNNFGPLVVYKEKKKKEKTSTIPSTQLIKCIQKQWKLIWVKSINVGLN